MFRLSLCLLLTLGVAGLAGAQTMSRTYGSNNPNDFVQAGDVGPDGSLVVLGYFENVQNGIARFDPAGNFLWARAYQGVFLTDVAVAPDGDIVTCGSESGVAFSMKVRATDGSVLWTRTTLSGNSVNNAVAVSPNGEVMTAGRFGNFPYDTYLASLSGGGGLFQDVTMGTSFETDEAHEIAPLAGGGFAVASTTNFSGNADRNLWVQKVDPRGLPLWSHQLGTSGEDGLFFEPAVAELTNGDIVVTAGRNEQLDANDDLWVVALDPSTGAIRWERTLALPNVRESGVAITGMADGGLAVLAAINDGSQADLMLVTMTAGGTLIKARQFGGAGNDFPADLVEAPNGDLVVFGTDGSFGVDGDLWILRVDSTGIVSSCCPLGVRVFPNPTAVGSDLSLTGSGLKFPGSNPQAPGVSSATFAWTMEDVQCATNFGPWTDLGNGLSGTTGIPCFAGVGDLTPNSFTANLLDGALPNALAGRVLGFNRWDLPLFGGVLVPTLDQIMFLSTDSQGSIHRKSTWPAGVPSGLSFSMQYLIRDPNTPRGWAFSNAIEAITP